MTTTRGSNGAARRGAADAPAGTPVAVCDLGYSEAADELDAIIAEFEEGVIDVDRLVERLERATQIVDELDRRLRRTRLQVDELVPRLEAIGHDDPDRARVDDTEDTDDDEDTEDDEDTGSVDGEQPPGLF